MNLSYGQAEAQGVPYDRNRESAPSRESNLSDVATQMRNQLSRSTILKERIGVIRSFLTSGAPMAIAAPGAKPREVPNGIVGDMAAMRADLADCFDSIECEIDRITVALGIDHPSGLNR